MFVDASALAAILLEEADGKSLSERIEHADRAARITSPFAIFEATLAVTRNRAGDISLAKTIVMRFLQGAGIRVVAIDADITEFALDAHERYGKGRHQARLNFGDCFAYAMAKRHGVPLLCKGDDFAKTDLA